MTDDNRPRRSRGRAASRAAWVFFSLAVVAQLLGPFTDYQVANIATAICIFVGSTLAFFVWVRDSGRWLDAILPAVILCGLVALGMTCFRFTGFSGELVPQFAWRFTPPPKLPEVQKLPDTPAVDPALAANPEAATDQAFPEFLGPGRRGYLPHRNFSTDWNANPPEVLWKQPIGAGWSGFSILGELALTMEQRDAEEWVSCYRITDGSLVWRFTHQAYHQHPLGGAGPRATPTLAEGFVYAQGATGMLWCLDLKGELIWQADLFALGKLDQDTAESQVTWGRSGSPLVFDGKVVVPLGGAKEHTASLIAFDARTGEELWRGGDDQISYASPQLATVAGVRQILIVNESSASGHDPETGKKLWDFPWQGQSNGAASVSQPMPVGEDKILLSKGYGGGSALLHLIAGEQSLIPEVVWQHSNLLKTKFTNAVIRDGFAYALSDGSLECVDLQAGRSLWKQSRRSRYGQGQILGVEDVLIVLSEGGEVALVKAQSESFEELARIPVISGTTWNTIALSDRFLLVRNSEEAACLRLAPR